MSIDTQALMRAVECVVSFFIIGFIGYYLAKRRWFGEETSSALSRFVTTVTIPVTLLYTINVSTTKEYFLPLLRYILMPVASILIVMLLAAIAARAVGMKRSHRNVFISAAACSNTINIGLPINLVLFGTEALPPVLIYYMGNTLVFWTLGNYLMASDARDAEPAPLVSLETVKRFFSPPILAFLAGLALLVMDAKIPPLLGLAGSQIAGMNTPLSILCIGIAIFQADLANIRLSRDVGMVAIGRFVASPLVVLGLVHFFPVPEMMRNVFIIQSSLPPMTNIGLMAIRYKSAAGYASIAISFCTLCALLTVPIFMLLLSSF